MVVDILSLILFSMVVLKASHVTSHILQPRVQLIQTI